MFSARIAGLTSSRIVELAAKRPALMNEVAAIAPFSFFLSLALHAFSARTAPVHAMMPAEPMKRHWGGRGAGLIIWR